MKVNRVLQSRQFSLDFRLFVLALHLSLLGGAETLVSLRQPKQP